MQAYQDNIALNVNGSLVPVAGVLVTVIRDGAGAASLFDIDGVTPIANPLTTDSLGYFGFKAVNGDYTLSFSSARVTVSPRKLQLYDPDDDTEDVTLAALAASGGSNLVGFIASGTGAVARTEQGKLRERPSLLDFMTDAQRADVIGNLGVLDVTAAVQTALDAYVDPDVPAGTYKLTSPLIVTSNLTLKGKKRKAILKADTGFVAGNVTRTYVDSASVTQTLTWNDKAIFYLVCPTNSYLTDINLDGLSFDLPSDGSIGVFNAQRVAISSFRNLYCNYSLYFVKGFDVWMTEWAGIRSQFSKSHFELNTGTSNSFTNCYSNTKYSTGGNGFSFTNLDYTVMNACAADSLDRAYYFNNSKVTLNGCGAESFSRILHVVGGSNVVVNGGSLGITKSTSATSTYFPYQFSDSSTKVTLDGAWIGVTNPAVLGGTYSALIVEGGAELVGENLRYPSEIGGGTATTWWTITGASVMSLVDSTGTRYINAKGISRRDGLNNLKAFEYSKTISAGSAQSIFRIAQSSYGDSCSGKIRVYLINGYGVDLGFSGAQEYVFSAFKETTTTQNITKIGESFTSTNTALGALGTVTGTLLRNGDNTIDFQLNVGNAPVVANTNVVVFVEYMTNSATTASSNVITGV